MAYTPAGVEVQVKVLANHLTGAYQSKLRMAAKAAVKKHLQNVQRDWGNDVRVDSGDLKESILDPDAIQIESNGLEGTVASDVGHAEVNEYGSVHMSARPSARQAAEKNRPAFESEMAQITRELG